MPIIIAIVLISYYKINVRLRINLTENMELTIIHFIALSSLIFTIGICGICINRKNVLVILMSIELMLLSVNINFVGLSSYYGNIHGQIFTIFVLTIAAAESALGLAILLVYFRNKNSIEVEEISSLKG